MSDAGCVAFLKWALPRLRLRWPGFRRVRRQVCKRVEGRVRELGLADLDAYRALLESRPAEWDELDRLCRITISRFHRDRAVWEALAREVLPALGSRPLAWSAGCASGEEPYTLALLGELRVVATDVDETVLRRARAGEYGASSLKELPPEPLERGFVRQGARWRIRPEIAARVTFLRHDLRAGSPDGPFDLVLCRNLAFTYFDEELQREVAATLAGALRPGGALVVGAHEHLPDGAAGFEPWPGAPCVHRRIPYRAGPPPSATPTRRLRRAPGRQAGPGTRTAGATGAPTARA